MERGSSFHSRGAATTKDLSTHECLDLGSINSNFSFDRKFLEGMYETQQIRYLQRRKTIYSLINNE